MSSRKHQPAVGRTRGANVVHRDLKPANILVRQSGFHLLGSGSKDESLMFVWCNLNLQPVWNLIATFFQLEDWIEVLFGWFFHGAWVRVISKYGWVGPMGTDRRWPIFFHRRWTKIVTWKFATSVSRGAWALMRRWVWKWTLLRCIKSLWQHHKQWNAQQLNIKSTLPNKACFEIVIYIVTDVTNIINSQKSSNKSRLLTPGWSHPDRLRGHQMVSRSRGGVTGLGVHQVHRCVVSGVLELNSVVDFFGFLEISYESYDYFSLFQVILNKPGRWSLGHLEWSFHVLFRDFHALIFQVHPVRVDWPKAHLHRQGLGCTPKSWRQAEHCPGEKNGAAFRITWIRSRRSWLC